MLTQRLLGRVRAVLTGRAVSYTRPGTRSAIAKELCAGEVRVRALGLDGDEQGDLRVHGGPDKAVHFYAWEHYARWIDDLGALAPLLEPGAFGENLCTSGVTEASLCIADELRIGTTLLQVTQARQPCWKLNDRFGIADMARRLQQTRRTGWYCRVLEPGIVSAGSEIRLVVRPHPAWSLDRLIGLLYHRGADDAQLREALCLPLVPSWRRLVERRLSTGRIEAWTDRLEGPDRAQQAGAAAGEPSPRGGESAI